VSHHIDGFETPLHHALTDPILLGGVPRAMAIYIGTLAAALCLGMQMWVTGVVLWVVFHTMAVFAAKRDPQFGEVIVRHLHQKGHFTC
jgi:type IV secretion system protein VirB3